MAEEQILVIQLRQLGDILLTTPCLKALKKQRPKARITFLSHAMGRLVLDDCPFLDEHFFYAGDATKLDEWRLAMTLRERQFDLVLDFMNNPRSAFYAFTSGAPRRLAFRSARRAAYTEVVPRPSLPRYIVRDKFELIKAAGFEPGDEGLVLPWNEGHTKPLFKLLGETPAFKEAPLRVALSPTHRRPVRRWPLPRFAALADRLQEEWGATVLWVWGPGEEALIDEVRAFCRTPTVKAPKTSFREMAALVANCDLFIGNSNGPSHVAVATGICSLQLHGHTSAAAWCPLSEKHRAVQAPEFQQMRQPTLEGITPESVWTALEGMRATLDQQTASRKARGPRVSWRS